MFATVTVGHRHRHPTAIAVWPRNNSIPAAQLFYETGVFLSIECKTFIKFQLKNCTVDFSVLAAAKINREWTINGEQ